MQLFLAAEQVHGIEQSDQSKKMIAMQVADKNTLYPLHGDVVPSELKLGAFSAIYQKEALICIEQMSA